MFQFGTSRFLQAHVALFASEAAAVDQGVPAIIVVQMTGDAARARRVAAFGRPEGYPVRVRGLADDGSVVDRTATVRSIVGGLAAARDWTELVARFTGDAAYVVSNTGDDGWRIADEDRTSATLAGAVALRGFVAMLLALLHHRWRSGGSPVTLLPCELMRRNGDVLKNSVGSLAREIGAEAGFLAWLEHDCLWINTLVDRIVSEPIEPIGAVAEPYALWAVERRPGLVMPFRHPDVVLTDDLDRYERLKLHILNLGHSWLAQRWIDAGRPAGATVRDSLADATTRAALARVYADEVVPAFRARGLCDDAAAYVERTLSRFANPFLEHRLSDIAASHAAKLEKRIGGFLDWVGEVDDVPPMPALRALAGRQLVAA